MREFKRTLIRSAAKQVFAAAGISGASVREIASAAGYTTGAIYTYYATKEELYADVLRDSLNALHEEVLSAAAGATTHRAAAALRGMWRFYRDRPADFDLGFYLYGGARPIGLNPELNRELNALLDRVMDLIGQYLVADWLATTRNAHQEAVSSAAYVFGLLLMDKTGRLRSLHEDAEALLNTYLNQKGTR